MKSLEDRNDFFIRSSLHGYYQDTIDGIIIEDKKLSVSPVRCEWETASAFGHYLLLGINNLGNDLVGVCLQFIHRFPL